jgi:DNA primase
MERHINSWHTTLLETRHALDYVLSRGATLEQVKHFRLGYSPIRVVMDDNGKIRYGAPQDGGLIIFPLTNMRTDVVGWSTRPILEKNYCKYFMKGAGTFFFGLTRETLQAIWAREEIFLTEGVFDFFPIQRIYPNSLCLTSANMAKSQNLFLKRFAKKICLCLDNDATGREATKKIMSFANGYKCRYIRVGHHDIADAWKALGDIELKRLITSQL